jgi:hypothetical protein
MSFVNLKVMNRNELFRKRRAMIVDAFEKKSKTSRKDPGDI